ncbi:MAG: MGMT family protein [Chitinophagales bacterium]|nr:MGMT family protein [Chitinophagales bacterium]
MKDKGDFFTNVYEVVRLIPYGRVSTYGLIARYLGAGKSARTVGYAMNNAHQLSPPVPAHRVVNRNGMLTGKFHFNSITEMEELLAIENIQVEKDIVQNFKRVIWDPNLELL